MNLTNIKKIKKVFKILADTFSSGRKENMYVPFYRILEIYQDEEDEYIVEIQLINKNIAFKAKPEEILANNNLVDQFSPRDIRTLTYLGYLGINSPKYKILAKRLSENDEKLVFALKKRGDKKILVKSAEEILKENDVIDNLNSRDARLIGYTLASETTVGEKKQKEELLKQLKNFEENNTKRS